VLLLAAQAEQTEQAEECSPKGAASTATTARHCHHRRNFVSSLYRTKVNHAIEDTRLAALVGVRRTFDVGVAGIPGMTCIRRMRH